MLFKNAPIGIFDSGVGGLSVARAIRKELPDERIIYFADQAHVPYGSRTLNEVRTFAEEISRFLLHEGVKLIVVACNAASAAALYSLREKFSDISFVGMEPAVKPAAENTQSGIVGVLATPATFQGALYASVVERFANGVHLLQDTCPGLVDQIENGELDTLKTEKILERALNPMLTEGIDTVVLGCTHYPFVIPTIQKICGPQVRVIDPAPAIAKQVRRLLDNSDLFALPFSSGSLGLSGKRNIRILTSGSVLNLQKILPVLIGENLPVERVSWLSSNRLFDHPVD
jgi:glutamate racemase